LGLSIVARTSPSETVSPAEIASVTVPSADANAVGLIAATIVPGTPTSRSKSPRVTTAVRTRSSGMLTSACSQRVNNGYRSSRPMNTTAMAPPITV
jgi:hypothetical protein